MFTVRRFVCALALNLVVLSGAMFPEDKKPTDYGWGEKRYYLSMGSSSRKQSEIAKIEIKMNEELAKVPGIVIDRVKFWVVFGTSTNKDARIILRYEFDGNKERKSPKVKMFDVLNFSSESQRLADDEAREKWCAENIHANIISASDWGYDARHISIYFYDPAP